MDLLEVKGHILVKLDEVHLGSSIVADPVSDVEMLTLVAVNTVL